MQLLKKLNNKAFKASMGYTIGNYLLRGIGFITIPIFSRLMTQEDYGVYNAFTAYEGIVYLFIGVALHSCLKNAKHHYGDEKLNEFTSSVALIPIILFVVFLVVCNCFADVITPLMGMDRVQLNLLVIFSYASGVSLYYQHRLALDYNYKEYLKVSYFNAIVSTLLSLVLIITLFSEARYLGRMVGTVITSVIIVVYVLSKIFYAHKPAINKDYWKYGLRISMPIIPHGLGQVILMSFDRIMINQYVGSREAGIYSFAYTVYTIVQVTGNSLGTVFETWVFNEMKENRIENVKRRALQFFALLCVIACLVILVAPELIVILGSEKYKEAIYCVIPILVAGTFAMAYMIPSVLEYYYEKTKFIAIGTICAAMLNLVLNMIFIPLYGYIAAAYTTLVSYIVYFIFHCIISYKVSGVMILPIWGMIAGYLAVIIIAIFTFMMLECIWIRWLLCIGIIFVVGVVVYKFFKSGEKKKNE